jgi:ankyrin repeat protein
MKKLLIGMLALGSISSFAGNVCPKPNENVFTAFKIIEAKQSDLCAYLSTNIVAKDARNEKCETMFHSSIRSRNIQALTCLDSIGYAPATSDEINRKDPQLNLSPYEDAIANGDLETVLMMESRGGSFNKKNLILAHKQSKDVIEHLINTGHDVNAKNDKDGTTVLMYAILSNSDAVVNILIEAGANVNAKNNDGYNALLIASMYNRLELIKLLISAEVNINTRTNTGATALMFASRYSTKDVAELLINAGAEIHAKDNTGATALMFASSNSNKEVVELLIRAGAEINTKRNNGTTALMHASWFSNKEVVELLIRAGAEINVKDNDGETALSYSRKNTRDKDIVEFLISAGARD